MSNYGVKVKTKDSKRAQWLTSDGGLTRLLLHAAMAPQERAEAYALDIAESNPEVVEWARAEPVPGTGGIVMDAPTIDGGRWAFFNDDEVLAIHNAAWVEDQEYGMSESMREMMPRIEAELNARGWTRAARLSGRKEVR